MSVVEIQRRIAAIQSTFVTFAPGVAPTARAPRQVSSPGGADQTFAAVLDQAAGTGRAGNAHGGGAWAARLPAAGRSWAPDIERAAKAAGVDPKLVAAVAWTESGFKPDAVSGAGAQGLMQLMPATARGLGVDPRDPSQNLAGGARYLAEQLDRFGSVELALAAYNAGPAAVTRHGGIPPYSETRTYVTRVLDRLQTL